MANTLFPALSTSFGKATAYSTKSTGSVAVIEAIEAKVNSPSGEPNRATSRPLIQAINPSSTFTRRIRLRTSAGEPTVNARRRNTEEYRFCMSVNSVPVNASP